MNYYEETELIAIEIYREHLAIEREIALEAGIVTQQTTTTSVPPGGTTKTETKASTEKSNDPSKLTKATEYAKKILDNLMKWLERFIEKFTQNVKNMLTSHNGFKTSFTQHKAKYKPMDSITVTIYQYDTNYLNNVKAKFESYINNAFNNANSTDSNHPLNLDTSHINQDIAKILQLSSRLNEKFRGDSTDSDVSNVNQMYSKLKERFRGEKKQVTLKSEADLKKYEDMVIGYSTVESNFNGAVSKLRTRSRNIRREFNQASRANPDNKGYYKTKLNNIAYLMKVYANLTANFTILYGEYMFTCREVCRRFYKMPTTQS